MYGQKEKKHKISEKYLRYSCCQTHFQHTSNLIKIHWIHGKGKGKGHPITGHEGPDGEQMYSSTLS
jgi:hypothetical protein